MKIGSETDMPNSVNRAEDGAYNAVLLSSASPAERSVCNGRTTVRPSLGRAHTLIAAIHHRLGRTDEARAVMAKATELWPGSTAAISG
jgi:Flp pilus assembly protein TadD